MDSLTGLDFEKWDVFVIAYETKFPTFAVITGKSPESYARIVIISSHIRAFACFSVCPSEMLALLESGQWICVGSLKQLLDETQC